MAGTCIKCAAKLKKNQTLCEACRKKAIEHSRGEKKILLNEALMYAKFHRQSSTKESVVAALAALCDVDMLNAIKFRTSNVDFSLEKSGLL